jgi:hypothetical protein
MNAFKIVQAIVDMIIYDCKLPILALLHVFHQRNPFFLLLFG